MWLGNGSETDLVSEVGGKAGGTIGSNGRESNDGLGQDGGEDGSANSFGTVSSDSSESEMYRLLKNINSENVYMYITYMLFQ